MNGLIDMINLKRQIIREKAGPDEIDEFLKLLKNKYHNPYTGDHFDWNPGEQTLSFLSPGNDFITNKLTIVFPRPEPGSKNE